MILWFRFTPGHCGAAGRLHGGVTAALLDEALGTVPRQVLGLEAMTGTLTIVYRAPALIGDELEIEAWADRVEGRKLHLRAMTGPTPRPRRYSSPWGHSWTEPPTDALGQAAPKPSERPMISFMISVVPPYTRVTLASA